MLPQEVVRGELEKGKGSQFDERIADIMIHMIDEDKDYCMREGAAEKYGLRERSEEETAAHMDEQPVLPEKLSMLKGIDTELGLFMCGDIEDYLDALSIFACSITSKAAKIEGALSENDIATYTTLVHSLKSSARTVGAAGVSDVAKRLETAGKQLDIDRIREETRELLASYRELETPLKEILEM